ncbi:MAG: SGNH/GDSL hydrolase family protein [Planctomycetota bacterium]|nr:SGNH/GDSL hydrolase family protein [Planctomycetota bacterium]
MHKPRIVYIAALLASVLLLVAVVTAAPPDTRTVKAKAAVSDRGIKSVTDVPGLPRVLLIGDSISIGYTADVQKLLETKANVHRIPFNGGPTSKALTYIDAELKDKKWDVIHFNWGLHDLARRNGKTPAVPPDQYEKNLTDLVTRLKKSGATLVWCSTTPVPDTDLNPPRLASDVVKYNAIAKKIMDANGIQINDLYAFALPKLGEIQKSKNVHFTDAGSKVLAQPVAEAIEKAIAKQAKPTDAKSAP